MIKKSNPNISALFAVIIAFGVTVSNTHVHFDDLHNVDTHHILVEEEYHCIICGSVFQFNPEAYSQSFNKELTEEEHFTENTEQAKQPYRKYREGRSPPITV